MYLPNISALLALPSPISPNEFAVAGYFEPGDGGGGTFVWITNPPPPDSPPGPDNGIIFYHPNDNSGYFKRLFSGPINVRWFGAKGDEETDDTAAVHLARDSEFTKMGGTLYFPKGVYLGAFEFYSDKGEVNILGDGQGSIL